ncbi:MAG TPA: Hg(II)-responsive transcriptional regulator [Burkholderiales bacterium]|nr:Hg(II)-responsive transcriptional regulator [Burkholderiales bacterium]
MPQMTIGRLARAAGVHVETIRYYQRLGLLESPARPPGGVRRYAARAVSRVRFIKRAQELGFSLAEIGRLMRLEDPHNCGTARSLASEKLALVESRIADLARLRGALTELIGRCNRRRGMQACPIIETLAGGQ